MADLAHVGDRRNMIGRDQSLLLFAARADDTCADQVPVVAVVNAVHA